MAEHVIELGVQVDERFLELWVRSVLLVCGIDTPVVIVLKTPDKSLVLRVDELLTNC